MIPAHHLALLRELVERAGGAYVPAEERACAAFELVGAMRYLLRTQTPGFIPVPARLDGDGSGSRVGEADGAATRSALEAGPSERENHRPRGER
ncbi:hypothetical protein TOK_4190 [Pseudonocardia sp. N23]|nr:hypothetical protein TOK_4190 [Pseudonocardia sp. N23]